MKPDRPMYADDMFINGLQQVFSVRTGDFLGYHRTGENLPAEQEPEPVKDPVSKDQLTLF